MRDITKVLLFRNDISPFLVHLTKITEDRTAKDNLVNILEKKALRYGTEPISDARFGYPYAKLNPRTKFYFSAISFTETPIGEVHNLMEIGRRGADLQPYGLVFIKDRLKAKGVSPVFYINNMNGDKDQVVRALCKLMNRNRAQAAQILPYVAIFGKKLAPMGATMPGDGEVDFTWEREWRYASNDRCFRFDEADVFIGLCPDEDITELEETFQPLKFIDPRRNMKWYAEKLVDARQRSDLKYSVV